MNTVVLELHSYPSFSFLYCCGRGKSGWDYSHPHDHARPIFCRGLHTTNPLPLSLTPSALFPCHDLMLRPPIPCRHRHGLCRLIVNHERRRQELWTAPARISTIDIGHRKDYAPRCVHACAYERHERSQLGSPALYLKQKEKKPCITATYA